MQILPTWLSDVSSEMSLDTLNLATIVENPSAAPSEDQPEQALRPRRLDDDIRKPGKPPQVIPGFEAKSTNSSGEVTNGTPHP
ncbi:hypothetical protein CSKR_200632 [Clonorchis sinensis]|uniref:Uncharacterized protein n=1 Tax=Clonorchis sinensis TaxID=79923 RepID=A0A8T1MGC4_CLOSI|nr:hypothetical protein CSKR_200632 [Clonorchis sinensis]